MPAISAGTINDVKTITEWAHEAGALCFVDAVQYAPHGLIDVKAIGCDFLACSAYKFFGPHVGILYGKAEHLARLNAYKVRPASDAAPDKWESGTKNHEGLAGVIAAVDYLAELGSVYGRALFSATRREKLQAAWVEIERYEQMLIERLIGGIQVINGARIYGISKTRRLEITRGNGLPAQGRHDPAANRRSTGGREYLRLGWQLLCAWFERSVGCGGKRRAATAGPRSLQYT